LMECINKSRKRVWKKRGKELLRDALIDIDGTLVLIQANPSAWKGEKRLEIPSSIA